MSKLIGRKVRIIYHELPDMVGCIGKVDKVESWSGSTFPVRVVFDDGEDEIFRPSELRYLNNRKVVLDE